VVLDFREPTSELIRFAVVIKILCLNQVSLYKIITFCNSFVVDITNKGIVSSSGCWINSGIAMQYAYSKESPNANM